jgi:hypothetical protein
MRTASVRESIGAAPFVIRRKNALWGSLFLTARSFSSESESVVRAQASTAFRDLGIAHFARAWSGKLGS